jgi:hypothetical protein
MAERVLGPTGSRRRRRFLFVPLLLGVCAAMFYIAGAQAVAAGTSPQDNGLFQLDGNTLPTTCASPFPGLNAGDGDDWAALFTHQPVPPAVTPPCGSDGFSFIADGSGNADHTYWSQGGSKDANDPALGPWLWKVNDVSPDKNDLVNAFAAIYTKGTDRFLYFGSDRFNTNGDAQQGFQFLQAATCLAGAFNGQTAGGTAACPSDTPSNPTGCTPAFSNNTGNLGYFVDPTTGCPVHHTNGDLLILVNFNQGGTLGLAGVYEWFGANGAGAGCYGTPPAPPLAGQCDQPVINGSGANCTTITGPDDFCSTANTGPLSEPVWSYSAKGGGTTYGKSAFIEGGVNLARIAGAGTCFPSFLAESRSSAGPSSGLGLTAQLKDLAFGRFELCAPSTILTKTASPTTIRSGQSVTYTYRETNDGRDPLTNVSVTDDKCSPLVRGTDDPGNNDATLSPGETWVFTCTQTITTANSTVTNTATGSGFDTGLNKTVTFCANPSSPPANTFCDQDERAQATVTIIHPATSLTQNASIAVTFTYVEDNTGDDTLTSPTVTDTNCSPVTYSSGDTNNDGKLQPDETWTFTCSKAATTSGTDVNYTAAATGSGTDSLGGSVGGASDPKENESVDVKVTHHHHS